MPSVNVHSGFGTQENKIYHYFQFFLCCLPRSDGIRCHDLSSLMMSFKPAFLLYSFSLIKKLFSSSSFFFPIRVVSSAYLRLLIFLPAIWISACDSFSPGFCMAYSAYMLIRRITIFSLVIFLSQFWEIESVVPCSILTVASWPTCKLLRRQVRLSAICLSKNFLQL